MATRFPNRLLTLSTLRRMVASSMTSSWYSEARWTSSTATAPIRSSSVASLVPAVAVARASRGRSRLPPAEIRCVVTSSKKPSPVTTEALSRGSSRRSPSCRRGRPRASVGFTLPNVRSQPSDVHKSPGPGRRKSPAPAFSSRDARRPRLRRVQLRPQVHWAEKQRGARRGGQGVRTFHRPGTEGVGAGAGRSAPAQSQLHRYRAHPSGAHPRGRGCRREGTRVPGDLPRGRAREGRRDDRHGGHRTERFPSVHAAGQEGPGVVTPRGAATRPQLHRHRAHAPRSRARGRRRCGDRVGEPRGGPRPGAPAGHPAHVGQPGQGVRRREPGRQLGRQPLGLAGARPVRPEPHAAGPRRQARPRHRTCQRDRARHAGPVAPHQEQPRPHRRTRRGQDRHRRGARPAHRVQRGARDADGQAALHARPRRPGGGQPLPRRLRGAPEEGAQGDPHAGRHRPLHRRDPHPGRRGRRRGRHRRGLDPQADAGAGRIADRRCDHDRRVPQAPREGRRARAALPTGQGGPADRRADDRHPQGPARPLRIAPRGQHHRPGARGCGQPGRPLPGRPLPAGQGDRPHRRGGQPPAHPPHEHAPEREEARRGDHAPAGRQGSRH